MEIPSTSVNTPSAASPPPRPHLPGHLCLYEPNQKFLLSGDHILGKITPNISLFVDDLNPLNDYLQSPDKTDLEVEQVLPAHRQIFTDCRGRINQLKQHHDKRTAAIMNVLKKGPQNAYEIASRN